MAVAALAAVGIASMGPPSLNGGNLYNDAVMEAPAVPLQWGRRLSTAETGRTQDTALALYQLQWGRRLSTAETLVPILQQILSLQASMGPPSLNGGN